MGHLAEEVSFIVLTVWLVTCITLVVVHLEKYCGLSETQLRIFSFHLLTQQISVLIYLDWLQWHLELLQGKRGYIYISFWWMIFLPLILLLTHYFPNPSIRLVFVLHEIASISSLNILWHYISLNRLNVPDAQILNFTFTEILIFTCTVSLTVTKTNPCKCGKHLISLDVSLLLF